MSTQKLYHWKIVYSKIRPVENCLPTTVKLSTNTGKLSTPIGKLSTSYVKLSTQKLYYRKIVYSKIIPLENCLLKNYTTGKLSTKKMLTAKKQDQHCYKLFSKTHVKPMSNLSGRHLPDRHMSVKYLSDRYLSDTHIQAPLKNIV